MAKRGRPRTNVKQPTWMFFRMMFALYAYNETRRAGVKHSSAISEAVCFVRSRFPEMPISETEVKRVVAWLQPKGCPFAYWVKSEIGSPSRLDIPAAVRQKFGLPESFNPKHCFTFGLGSQPAHRRNNAKDLNQNKSLVKTK